MPSDPSSLLIDATDIARRFGANWVLRGVTLGVRSGEVVGLLGVNGSGKSTLLRILATLLRPHAGTARIAGHDVVRAADRVRSTVGYLGHAPGVYDDLTARENLRFAAAMLARDARDVEDALERVDLSSVGDQPVRGFSSGMQRRLAIARLMLARPRVLLLDEPYSNLDDAGRDVMNAFMSELVSDGAAALVVLHELAPAAGLLDRTVTIDEGRLAARPAEAIDRAPGMSLAAGAR